MLSLPAARASRGSTPGGSTPRAARERRTARASVRWARGGWRGSLKSAVRS